MAVSRLTTEQVLEMLQQEPDEDEEAIFSDSVYDISDDDPEYLPHDQAGVVGVSGNLASLHEQESSQDSEDSSDESSEEETQTESNRLSKKGSYWKENPPHSWQNTQPQHSQELPRPSPWINSCFAKRCLGYVHEPQHH